MSYFPRWARVFVVLTLACGALTLPTVAVAAGDSRPRRSPPAAGEPCGGAGARPRRCSAGRPRPGPRTRGRPDEGGPTREQEDPQAGLDRLRQELAQPLPVAHLLPGLGQGAAEDGPKKWVPVEQASWRAGSGLAGVAGKDECHRGKGWSPNGTYSFVQHNRRKAPLINGRVFELESKACRNGTLRQLMFIHSEQNWDNTQCRNTKGDDSCRWEVPRVNDYRSWGCIKMARGGPQPAHAALPPLLQGGGALPDAGREGAGQELNPAARIRLTRTAAGAGRSSPAPRGPTAAG